MMHLPCECGRTLGYEPHQIGQTVRCPGCQRMLVVPNGVPDDLRDEDQEATEERPRRKRRVAQEEPRVGFMQTIGALLYTGPAAASMLVGAAIGIGLLVFGFTESKVASGATEKPQPITCQQLIAGGIPANPHVLISDVIPGMKYVTRVKVTKAEQAAGNTNKPWEAVYIPLLPLTQEMRINMARQQEKFVPTPPGNQIRLVLLSNKAKNITDLGAIFSHETVQGMIVNSISKLDTSTEDLLRQQYPGVDLSQVLILEEGRKPASQAFTTTMMAAGAFLIASALLLGIVAIAYRPRE